MPIEAIFQTFPQLETDRLILRQMQASDAEALFLVLGDDEVTRYYDEATFTSVSQVEEQIAAWESVLFTSAASAGELSTRRPEC